MTHPDLHPEDLIDRERRGEIAPAERQRLLAHLAACRACAAELALGRDVDGIAAPSPGDAALLERAASAAASHAGATGAQTPILRNLAAATVLLLVGSVAGAALWNRVTRPAPRSRAPSTEPAPVEHTAPVPGFSPHVGVPVPVPGFSPHVGVPGSASPAVRLAPRAVGWPHSPVVAASAPTAADLFARANEARRSGNELGAVDLYRELLATFPGSREATATRVTLGRLLLDRIGDAGGSLALFDAYLAGSPAGTLAEEARVGRALALGRLGRSAEERAAWEDLLARHPDSVHAPRARARLDALR